MGDGEEIEHLAVDQQRNPWVSIVLKPRETIRSVLTSDRWSNICIVYGIIILVAIPNIIFEVLTKPKYTDNLTSTDSSVVFAQLSGILIIVVVIGYPLAIGAFYVSGYFLKVIGAWFEGIGNTKDLAVAFVWCYVPILYYELLAILPGILIYYYLGPDSFASHLITFIGISFPMGIMWVIYSAVGISEVHQFSIVKGLATIFTLLGLFFLLVFSIALLVIA